MNPVIVSGTTTITDDSYEYNTQSEVNPISNINLSLSLSRAVTVLEETARVSPNRRCSGIYETDGNILISENGSFV